MEPLLRLGHGQSTLSGLSDRAAAASKTPQFCRKERNAECAGRLHPPGPGAHHEVERGGFQRQADLLLLDDPAASMDTAGRALVRQLLREAQGTVLITAPDTLSLPYVDTFWLLENGRIKVKDSSSPIRRPLALLTSPSQKPGPFLELPGHSCAAAAAGAIPYSLIEGNACG